MKRLESGNVVLREFTSEDKFRIAELANNPKISINLRDGFPNPYSVEDAELFLEKYASLELKLFLKKPYSNKAGFSMKSGMQKLSNH